MVIRSVYNLTDLEKEIFASVWSQIWTQGDGAVYAVGAAWEAVDAFRSGLSGHEEVTIMDPVLGHEVHGTQESIVNLLAKARKEEAEAMRKRCVDVCKEISARREASGDTAIAATVDSCWQGIEALQ